MGGGVDVVRLVVKGGIVVVDMRFEIDHDCDTCSVACDLGKRVAPQTGSVAL